MALLGTRTLRGALAGGAAAAGWAALEPLDQRVFRFPYSDVELLGKLVTRNRAWYPAGLAWHLGNGALFGAAYATVAPSVPAPPLVRGLAAGLAEHLATWPLTRLVERHHPARRELPRLSGSRRAFAQATWRHALFAVALAELERRLNPPEPVPGLDAVPMSSNGHRDVDRLVAVGPAAS